MMVPTKPPTLLNAVYRPQIPYRQATTHVISGTIVFVPLIPDATSKADMDNSFISYILSLKPY